MVNNSKLYDFTVDGKALDDKITILDEIFSFISFKIIY